MVTIIFTVNWLTLSACENPPAVNYENVKKYIVEDYLKRQGIAKDGKHGLSLALVDDQKIVWADHFGLANRAANIKVTGDTLFYVGSISKLFTATAIMQLVEAGKVDLDAPLQTYLPNFAMQTRFPLAGPITIRSILTHHSGLPCDLYSDHASYDLDHDFGSLLPKLRNEYVAYPSNFMYAYSNLGFELLGEVICEVSKKETGQKVDFNDYMVEKLLKPLGMSQAAFRLREAMKANLAQGYEYDAEKQCDRLLPLTVERRLAAGGLIASVNELSNFIKMVFAGGRFQGNTLLKKATLMQMMSVQNCGIPLDLDIRAGLGWELDEVSGLPKKVAGHSGDRTSYNSQLLTLPDCKLGVVVLANSKAIASSVAVELLRKAYEAKTGETLPAPAPTSLPELSPEEQAELDQQMTPAVMQRYEGHYAITPPYSKHLGSWWSVRLDGKKWCLRVNWFDSEGKVCETKFALHCRKGGWFSSPGINVYFRFSNINGMQVLVFKSLSGIKQVIGEKLPDDPLPEIWQKRNGHQYLFRYYGPEEHQIRAELSVEGKLILLNYDGEEAVVLTPLSDDRALVRGLGRGGWEVVQWKRVNGKETILWEGLQGEKIE